MKTPQPTPGGRSKEQRGKPPAPSSAPPPTSFSEGFRDADRGDLPTVTVGIFG